MPEPTFDAAPNDLPPPDRGASPRPPRSTWDCGSDRSHVKTFVLAASLMGAIGLVALAVHEDVGALWRRAFGPPLTADEMRDRIGKCERSGDLPCAQETLEALLRKQPDDAIARAHLGLVMTHRDDDAHAVVEFKRAIDSGEGTYDLFAWYADALARLGRSDEAIEWSYRSLSLVPNLVDVRGKLARLLVARGRAYEALSLLESFDANALAKGHEAYFEGQRIAIESALAAPPAGGAAAAPSLRLPVMEGHFYAPVALGTGRPMAFMVDTGATTTTVTPELLDQARVAYRVLQPMVTMTTADGRHVSAQGIVISALSVGPYVLHDVPAVRCEHCAALLGQASLSHFDLQSTRTQGVEFLTLTPRGGI
jgi:clan AA aspartic protease (TIGR02281 family)